MGPSLLLSNSELLTGKFKSVAGTKASPLPPMERKQQHPARGQRQVNIESICCHLLLLTDI